jgi:phospho-N-acetylmuramoyl-pentapeptide-transferase
MFYYLSNLRDFFFGFNIFKYITFRAAMAAVTTFALCIVFGPIITRYLQGKKIREYAKREDCPDLDKFVNSKQGVPTMGGIFIIGSILLSVLFWADLGNHYILLTMLTTLYLAVLGFVDDYVKLTKHDSRKRGLPARTKLLWQVLLGFFIGAYVYFSPNTSTQLSVPFFKHLIFNIGVFYLPMVALIVIGTTNAVNLTDGLDGLAIGSIFIVSSTLAVLCYLSGNIQFSRYLFLPFLPGAGELTVFCAAMAGASLGFLWFNCHPATIFMGDTGSLSLGGAIAVIAVFIKQELLLVLLGGIFVVEALSVILQVASFKLRRKRIFKMSPIHHHLQLSGWHESKIIIRFWIIGIVLALLTLTTLKVR